MNKLSMIELEILMRGICFYLGKNSGDILKGKIQYMIDNYCDHIDIGECAICGVEVCCNCNEIMPGKDCCHE